MEIVADRFAVTDRADSGPAIDLATAESVQLTIMAGGDRIEHARWTSRCETLRSLRHRALATLLDYGPLGAAHRFEAWRCGRPWTGPPEQAARAFGQVSSFLEACGLSASSDARSAIHGSWRRIVVRPGAMDGYPDDQRGGKPETMDPAASLDACGFAIVERPAARALADLFLPGATSRPRALVIWGPPGSGRSTLVLEAARLARLNGFVPVSARLLGRHDVIDALHDRSLFLIGRDASAALASWTGASILSARPHALLVVQSEAHPAIDSVAVGVFASNELEASVRPSRRLNGLDRRIASAAVRSAGLPGRFVALLWPDRDPILPALAPRARGRGGIAAEQPAVYGAGADDACGVVLVGQQAWSASAELKGLCQRLDAGRRLLESGRHAPGERFLRQTISKLARRGGWVQASDGAHLLARNLLKRGQAKRAIGLLNEAQAWLRQVDELRLLMTAAVLTGTAWIDLARLDEAEGVLSAALATARAHPTRVAPAPVLLALARCAFWAGRYPEGDRLVASVRKSPVPDDVAVRAALMESRLAIGLRDFERAVTQALDAVARARSLEQPGLLAGALAGAAFAHLAVGDFAAVEHEVKACLEAAQLAHDPLCGVRARLLLAESARRRGFRSPVDRWLRRLRRLAGARLPPIVAARCALLNDLLTASAPVAEVVGRHVTAAGLPALALSAPSVERLACRGVVGPAIDDLVEILHVCQHAEEEIALLAAVCARLRRQLRAAGVAFLAEGGTGAETLAWDGARIAPEIARRAMDAGIGVGPHRHDDRIEAAVPVRYGGEVIGALASRWTLGAGDDLSDAAGVLAVAAAAAAPALAGGAARRFRTPATEVIELGGTSEAIAAVRQAIERAARAPFPVLIEGESGSGKELVARALHRMGPRRERAFCTVNCAALPDDLIEAELFGHARGAFTGAVAERPGVFEEAHHGTLLLDEIGELSPRAQAKVLRVLQEGELRRVGENVSRRVDVRIVAATNRNLRAEVDASRFRLDLLYRLDVVRISVPPLRDRPEDVAPLAEHFWREAASRVGSRATLAASTLAALAQYGWPGNVRELQNVLASLAVRCPRRGVVPPEALPAPFARSPTPDSWRLAEARHAFEERFVRAALVRSGGHRGRAASEMGVSRQGLVKLMARLGISTGT